MSCYPGATRRHDRETARRSFSPLPPSALVLRTLLVAKFSSPLLRCITTQLSRTLRALLTLHLIGAAEKKRDWVVPLAKTEPDARVQLRQVSPASMATEAAAGPLQSIYHIAWQLYFFYKLLSFSLPYMYTSCRTPLSRLDRLFWQPSAKLF